MALKAGYYGVKKFFIDLIESLVPIKSIGSGLVLSDEGELSLDGDIGSFSVTELLPSNVIETGKVTLSGNISDYDEIGFMIKSNYGGGTGEGRSAYVSIPVSTFKSTFPYTTVKTSPYLYFQGYGNEEIGITYGEADNEIYVIAIRDVWLVKVIGIKF